MFHPTIWSIITLLHFLLTIGATHINHHQQQQQQQQQQQYPFSHPASPHQELDIMSKSLNVFRGPLKQHSTAPMTGFLRNGYCDVPPSDFGNHAVAAEVTDEFLDFSASRGNDLRQAGLKGGCKWCLCASRWLEAFDAKGIDGRGDRIVPKVWLEATNESALKKIDLEVLKRYAVDKQ